MRADAKTRAGSIPKGAKTLKSGETPPQYGGARPIHQALRTVIAGAEASPPERRALEKAGFPRKKVLFPPNKPL